ncbi:MAG: hypothetical protein HY017_13350 [Betaproteobacteria bacterium]|nr:hypothetical protein [Betaproteobacteria bacterium]
MNDPQQIPLFDEHSNQGSRLVTIVAPKARLTKGQQTFNRLVEKIRQQRELLAEWQAFTLRCQQRVASELEPLRRELCEGQRQMCRLLDELLTAPPKGLGRRQRGKLVIMLEGVAQAVLVHGPDEEIEALHDKHARSTLEESQRAELKMTEAFVSAFLGEDMVKGHGAGSAEELFQHAQEKMQAGAAGRAEADAQRAQARAARRGERPAKADLAQQRREQAAKDASQSVREIYRKLVSALHPDRVTDPGRAGTPDGTDATGQPGL